MKKEISFLLKNKKVLRNASFDVIINIIANAIPVFVLQFFVQPLIAKELGAEANGFFLTIIALIHFVVFSTSASLNSTRLLMNREYEEQGVAGDFNIFLTVFAVLNLLVTLAGTLFYDSTLSLIEIGFIALLALIWMVKDYLIVQYRIQLKFTQILINNLLISAGFIIATLLIDYHTYWQVIFLIGYGIGLVHILFTTTILYEPIKKTKLFPSTKKKLFNIGSTNLLKMTAVSFDRLILFPILGGTLVSIYYASTIISKIMSLLAAPLSNVFLSYIVKQSRLSLKMYNVIVVISLAIGLVGYFISLKISVPLLHFLYPEWAEQSIFYVPITTGVALFELMFAFINPIILRFSDIRWQVRIESIYIFLYLLFGLTLLHFYGLLGFSLGVLFAAFLKFITMYFVGVSTLKTKN